MKIYGMHERIMHGSCNHFNGDYYVAVELNLNGFITAAWGVDALGRPIPGGDITFKWKGQLPSSLWTPAMVMDPDLLVDEGL
jgi:hypothetical protein